jgi:hypothetical protein
MITSRIAWTGTILALAALVPLDCRQAIPPKTSPTPENSAQSSNELRADEVTDVDKNAPPEKSAPPASASAPVRPDWEIRHEAEMERIHRERRARAQADWHIALRTDSGNIVPCQPWYATIKITNSTDQPRKLRELLGNSQFWVLVGRNREYLRVVAKAGGSEPADPWAPSIHENVVPGGASLLFDQMLTTHGSTHNNPAPKRIFGEPGEYNVYAAVVDPRERFEVLSSEPLVVTVRDPTDSEVPYVEFFREGRQIPPHYGFSAADQESIEKLRDLPRPDRSRAFQRKVDLETIDKLREMLAKHPDPAVADDMRHYLMVLLTRSAWQYDDKGHRIGYDRAVLTAAAEQYLEIAPERKQLRRRSINTWRSLSSEFNLDHAQPVLQILASWKAASPFYEDEAESQAALDEIIAKIEARYAQHARARAEAEARKAKLPTN